MEIWNVVDENRRDTGQFHSRGDQLTPGDYHVVVEIYTINPDGRLLVTQRDPVKTSPLSWEFTGGSITRGETSKEGALRELEEETSLIAAPDELQFLGELKRETHFLDSYIWKSAEPIKLESLSLQTGEVCDARLVTLRELDEMNAAGSIVPTVWKRFELYRKTIEKWAGEQPSNR
ncbi:NUDIX hydrolase [Indiicoccus explosivorum]|uniref:NUDIX hydrolase n=1 Tax=Indiicoccus explosivorum TaxID=1917864 RepID=UPI0013904B46|nr:NUDIX domain-containing protein [Indiicoccus explosivorum]